MALTNFFSQTVVSAHASQAAKDRRCPVILQLWVNSKKAKTSEDGIPFITLRATILEFNAEKGNAIGLEKGQRIQIRFFEETEKAMTAPAGIGNPLDPKAKCFFGAGWLQFDAEPWVRTYEKVDDATGEVTEAQSVTTTAKIRGLAFGRSQEEALSLMDQLVEQFKAEKAAKIEEAKARRAATV